MTPSKILQAVLGVLVVAGFFGVMFVVMNQVVPAENREVFLMLTSQLTGAFLTVVGFAFGSSFGSQRKDELHTRKDQP